MQHRVRISLAVTAVALSLGAAACGSDPDGNIAPPAPVAATTSLPLPTASPPSTAVPQVSADDAVAVALEAVGGGQVLETDVEDFEIVVQVWEVTVVTPDGLRHKVTVDMANGSVVGNEVDD